MLQIGDWKFRVDLDEPRMWLSAQGKWGFEVVCEPTEIQTSDGLSQRFAPTLSIRDVRYEGRDWRGLGGQLYEQVGAWQGDGDPVADLFVLEHATIFEAKLRVLGPDGDRFHIELDAVGDVFFDDAHDTDVPLSLRVDLPLDGVEFRFRAEGADSLSPEVKAAALLTRHLDLEGFETPRITPVSGSPGIFHAFFPPAASEDDGGAAAALADDEDVDPVLRKAAYDLLSALVAQELLEVEEGGLQRITGPLVEVLEMGGRGERRASRVAEWLIDHDDVIDLHIQDEDLAELLDKLW